MWKRQSVKDALASASMAVACGLAALWWFLVMSIVFVLGCVAVAIDKVFGICFTHSCK